ncbi:hypothetical protein MFLO_11769 [Listeria floridensis FSL S10-1187]|uniref:Carbohydrate deacetylase n=1 Tax=Listeria floridensis FSL S10-1187 TaxID=1265817 RepID=A0ABP3AW25_9LIST|nr:carbohydrate deacetylase [Listeria floridensis]EUJ28825.1 hypothetical protein MFLO_11769 [Listeria floridensis FSL S10-1187]
MKLIFNADDFAMTKGVTYGILEAYRTGVVKSTTMLANGLAFDLAAEAAKANPGLDIGIHLTLTFGRPVSKDVKTLVNKEGRFYRQIEELMATPYSKQEVEREFIAQIEKVEAAGIRFTHFDMHHIIEPHVYEIQHKLAAKYGVSVRRAVAALDYGSLQTPDLFLGDFYGDEATLATLAKIIETYKNTDKVIELMTHPAFLDEDLLKISSYTKDRMRELSLLTSPELFDMIKRAKAKVISYKEL